MMQIIISVNRFFNRAGIMPQISGPGVYIIFLIFLLMAQYSSAAVSPVSVDIDHGFYDTAFTVRLSSGSQGATIQYTLDCSDPRFSPTMKTAPSPVSILIDPRSTDGRTATPAVVLRAVAVLQNDTSTMITKTYIFINEVLTQKYPGPPWPEPTKSGGFTMAQEYDYEMDSAVVHDPRYEDLIDEALLDIPSISLVLDMDSLFDKTRGIYHNALKTGPEWERFGYVELINPDGSFGFSIPCGIRIRGGWSRHADCPKHSFRLFFREKYGASKLRFPLFEDEGVSEFDKISLRTSQNYSWSYKSTEGAHCTMIKDVYCRDSQRDMGHYYTRSRYYHLYLNGMYWGIYQTQEQADNRFAESYMGGDYLDYDVLCTVNDYTMGSDRDKTVEVEDGTIDAAQRLWTKTLAGFSKNSDYYMVQGLESDGKTVNPSYEKLLDVDNLIDYMLITFYTGNFDSPTYAFSEPQRTNNLQAIFNRVKPDGFKWMSHDGEHTMVDFKVNQRDTAVPALMVDRTGPFKLSDDIRFFNPQRIHQALCENSDYRIRFADHVFRHFFNNGVFCPEQSKKRYQARAAQIENAIIAESARWGDSKVDTARTKDDDWLPELERIYNEYMPKRTEIVVEQLREDSLYPSIKPPVFSAGQTIIVRKTSGSSGYSLTITNPNSSGTIFYTTDGNDPRSPGGVEYSGAENSTGSVTITINTTTLVNARIRNESEWSALRDLLIVIPQDYSGLKITEIHYKPIDNENNSGNLYEFIELKNTGKTALNLTGLSFGSGVSFAFEPGTILQPDSFFVIASDRAKFKSRYGFNPHGEYRDQLSNSGEKLEIVDPSGKVIYSVTYKDAVPWPEEPDKTGRSLVPSNANPTLNPDDGKNWVASRKVHGSPGRDDLNSAGASVKNQEIFKRGRVCQVGPFRIEIPFEKDYQVSILNIQGKVVNSFAERGKTHYQWNPVSNGLFLVRFKNAQGEQVIRKVQVLD
jgi:hypothetical protein